MRTFELADDSGNVATIKILDNMPINEATDIIMMNGHNDESNFAIDCERFMYRGTYFYSYEGGYCVEWSNQDFCHDDIEVMKEFISSTIAY